MGVAEWSRDHVEELLADLEQQFPTVPVSQTTVTLAWDDYRRVATRCRQSVARVDVRVENDDGGVLMVESDGELKLPGGLLDDRGAIKREAQVAVHRTAGVECVIEGLDHATIAGISNGDDPDSETFYRLFVLLNASTLAGTPSQSCQWQQEDPSVDLIR